MRSTDDFLRTVIDSLTHNSLGVRHVAIEINAADTFASSHVDVEIDPIMRNGDGQVVKSLRVLCP